MTGAQTPLAEPDGVGDSPNPGGDSSNSGGAHSATSDAPVEVVAVKAKSVKGKKFVLAFVGVLIVVVLGNLYAATNNKRLRKERAANALVFRDVKLVRQDWKKQADGMTLRATVVNENDTAHLNQIRSFMKHQRTEYLRANYSDPKFANNDIPGRASLEYATGNEALNCRYKDIPNGGELQFIAMEGSNADSPQKAIVIDSLIEWATEIGTSPVQ
jgi:type II secretory pathway pseudopilin PulG